MVFNANIFRCQNCGFRMLAEEIESHKCMPMIDYRLDNDILWITDGKRWYPLKFNNGSQQRKNQHNHVCGIVPSSGVHSRLFRMGC